MSRRCSHEYRLVTTDWRNSTSVDAGEVHMTSETRTHTFLFTLIVACGALSFGLSIGLSGLLSSLQPATLCLPLEFSGDADSSTYSHPFSTSVPCSALSAAAWLPTSSVAPVLSWLQALLAS
jgi:hypothetical protein